MESPQHLPHYTSQGASRMAIDSLLNPSAEAEPSSSMPRPRLYSTTSSSSSAHHAQLSPRFPPSPTTQGYFNYPSHLSHHHHSQHHHHHQPSYSPYSYSNYSYSPHSPHSPTTSDLERDHDRDPGDRGSVSSSSSTGTGAADDGRRPPRPKYEEEEMFFIWYHRVDLGQEWKEVRESFNRQFPSRQRAGFQGIQCKFYRFIREKSCPTLREQRRMRDGEFLREGAAAAAAAAAVATAPGEGGGGGGGSQRAPKFGVVEWTGVWYPWMREGKDEVRRKRIT